jgi:hypothetical protein
VKLIEIDAEAAEVGRFNHNPNHRIVQTGRSAKLRHALSHDGRNLCASPFPVLSLLRARPSLFRARLFPVIE